jgi:hypothetical protein
MIGSPWVLRLVVVGDPTKYTMWKPLLSDAAVTDNVQHPAWPNCDPLLILPFSLTVRSTVNPFNIKRGVCKYRATAAHGYISATSIGQLN